MNALLLNTLLRELMIAVTLVGSVHSLALWLRRQLKRATAEAQSLVLAISIVWVVAAGPSTILILEHEIGLWAKAYREHGLVSPDPLFAMQLLLAGAIGMSVCVAIALIAAGMMEWHARTQKRSPPRKG
jgi:hypothetical protein